MKRYQQTITAAALAAFGLGLLLVPVDGNAGRWGQGKGQQAGLSTMVANLPMQDLSPEEEISLAKMREEEKLARDVYRTLYDKWKLQVFANITRSEQRHMDAVGALLDKYNRPDPVTDPATGVFTDPAMQRLYTALVEQGLQSPEQALQVGATIEDLDIKDLYDLLAQTDNTDIKTVYQNLAKGSRNHLRAFTAELSSRGKIYAAQYLTQDQINDIITAPHERGRVDENGVQVSGRQGGGKGMGRHGRGNGGCRFQQNG